MSDKDPHERYSEDSALAEAAAHGPLPDLLAEDAEEASSGDMSTTSEETPSGGLFTETMGPDGASTP